MREYVEMAGVLVVSVGGGMLVAAMGAPLWVALGATCVLTCVSVYGVREIARRWP